GRLVASLQREDGSFSERTPTNGVYFPEGMGLFDGDLDGNIDVYLACYEGENTDDKVLRGLGDGNFEDVTQKWCGEGAKYTYAGRGVNPADYDNDGRTDVYVSNYRLCPNILWRNRKDEEGTTKLIDCAAAPWFGDGPQPPAETDFDRGVQGIATPYEDKEEGKQVYFGHTIGSVWGDLDNNGTLDLVCANLAHPRFITMGFSDITRVYLNRGSSFEDHTVKANITFSELHSDPMLADFDNDGYLDLSITNVYKHAMNQFYLGGPGATFREVTHRVGGGVFNGWGQAAGDFDNDGDLDLFISGILASDDKNRTTIALYENTLVDKGTAPWGANFVKLKLIPPKGVNGMAYGARVTVTANGKQWTRDVFGMRGTSSCDDQVVHVGLGAEKGPVDVTVRWMGDKASTHQSLAVNTTHRLKVE
ncbi:MAG: CRTAC1 family protein, partial [Planctomycetes bacterium]|nr:CRTAC1 family protein [Planctomycetota bacterium]